MTYDKEKVLEQLFDPNVSEILTELENEGKESSHLCEKLKISEQEIRTRLSYLLEHNFVKEKTQDGKTIFLVNKEKLDEVVKSEKNFQGVVDGLTEMDSFLN